MIKAAVDNDVLYKGACYGLLVQLIEAIPAELGEVGILGLARFVVGKKLCKAKLAGNQELAIQIFDDVLQHTVALEPTPDEKRLAAEFEYTAHRANLNLDQGESQLCAIVIIRAAAWFVTGDKRAVSALEQLFFERRDIGKLARKVLCLEQLFLRLASEESARKVRKAVCDEPSVDKALAICFSCSSPEVGREIWAGGLRSYIANLRNLAPTVLAV